MMQKTGKIALPEGARIALTLTFDFDASSVWMSSFGKTSPAYMSRGEFGACVAVPRILDLLDRYGIKTTFFVPGHTLETFPEAVEEILARGHEVGHHGYVHEDPTDLTAEEEERILIRGLESLDRLGIKPLGYRSPGFDFSTNTLGLLEKYGFAYDSSLMGNDFYPYHPAPVHVHFDKANEYDPPSPLVEFPLSWYLDDFPHAEFVQTRSGMKPQSHILEIWKTSLDYGLAHMPNALLDVAMHPQVSGRPHMIAMLEEFLCYALEQKAWIAPFSEVMKRVVF